MKLKRNDIDFTPWLCSWPDSSKQPQGFPRRFWDMWLEEYAAEPMLHLFSGSCKDGHTRIDINPNSSATTCGDYQQIPLDKIYRSAFADPPYTQEMSNVWSVQCPKPSEILKVMRDACLPGSVVGVLHLQVLRPVAGLSKVAWHPVFCGTTKHIRCLSVFRVEEA